MAENLVGRPLSHVDAAWLRMDTPVNPMVITSALTLEGKVPFEALVRVIEERFLRHERFTLRVADAKLPFVAPHWQRDAHFDIRSHVHHVRLPAPGGAEAFDAFVSDLMSSRLDRGRPLWQSYVVDDAPGGTALVSRLHHCLGDGISLVKVLLGLCDDQPAESPAKVGIKRAPSEHALRTLSARAASYTATMGRLLLLPSDPRNPLRGPLGTRKCATRCAPLPLSELKATAKRLGGTLNDLLAAIVAGALQQVFQARGFATAGLSVRALVPVFLRDVDNTGLGNHFGLVFLDLPLGIDDPLLRFAAVKRNMDQLKSQDDATVAFAVLDAVGVASTELEHIWLEVFSRKASVLMSNVPGPAEAGTIAGHKLTDVTVWAPVSGYLGAAYSAFSYAGKVQVSVHTDAGIVPDPRDLAEAFQAEAKRYLHAEC